MKSNFKIYCLLFICIISTSQLNGQSLSSLSLQFGLPDTYDGVVLSPTAQLGKNNHEWNIGPTILFSYGDQVEQRQSPKLTGLYIGYVNYVHGNSQKYNLFHSFDLYVQRVKDEQNSMYFDTASSSFQSFTINQTDKIIQLFANFGVSIKLSDKLSISQTIGIGVNATLRSTTSPFKDFNDPFVNQDWLLKTGLNYRFK